MGSARASNVGIAGPDPPRITQPGALPYSELSSEAGMLLLVPWYLMHNKDVKLHELAGISQNNRRPAGFERLARRQAGQLGI